MKKIILITACCCLTLMAATDSKDAPATKDAAAEVAAPALNLKDVSYCIGLNLGENFKQMKDEADVELDLAQVVEGLKSAYAGKESKLSEEEIKSCMMVFQGVMQKKQQEMQKKQMAEMAVAGVANTAKGKAFLEANAKKEGVKSTKSGLQYKVTEAGKGKKPTADNTVKVHYKGTLIDGTVFDSSIERGTPATFPLNGVIPGWTEGIQLMNVGGKTTFYIPAELAYGEKGAGGAIGPNETLIFEVELLGIED